MTDYLLAIDPGKSTGVALLRFTGNDPATLEDVWQVEGGIGGFLEWFDSTHLHYPHIVAEKFTPRQALSLDAAEPLVVEGAMIALGLIEKYTPPKHPQWQHPSAQYFAGGKTLAEKKKRSHAWLKSNGFYVTGKDVGCKDANDARSAILHGIAWFRNRKHAPTLERYFTA